MGTAMRQESQPRGSCQHLHGTASVEHIASTSSARWSHQATRRGSMMHQCQTHKQRHTQMHVTFKSTGILSPMTGLHAAMHNLLIAYVHSLLACNINMMETCIITGQSYQCHAAIHDSSCCYVRNTCTICICVRTRCRKGWSSICSICCR